MQSSRMQLSDCDSEVHNIMCILRPLTTANRTVLVVVVLADAMSFEDVGITYHAANVKRPN